MASVVWDPKGVLYIDYLEKGAIITEKYYSNLLSKLDKKYMKKICFAEEKIIFHQDNAPVYKRFLANGKN